MRMSECKNLRIIKSGLSRTENLKNCPKNLANLLSHN